MMKFSEYFGMLGEAKASRSGPVKLKVSSIDDPGIQRVIAVYAKDKGISVTDATAFFAAKVQDYVNNANGAMNKNARENACESVAFDLIGELDLNNADIGVDREDLLDRDYFFDLTQFVIGENSSMFPLKNPYERKSVTPYFYIWPDHGPMIKKDSVKKAAAQAQTAFCTPEAEMVYARKFCEELAVAAILLGAKSDSKKYKSNGGEIPDWYCYLEFVMLHELLHFVYGDHFFSERRVKRIKEKHPKVARHAHQILNFVGDFIINWQLVKKGYVQLPLGLFSEDLNHDKYDSPEELIDFVAEEFGKMTEQQQNDTSEQMSDSMDDHMDDENSEPSPGGKDAEPTEQGDSGDSGDSGGGSGQSEKQRGDSSGAEGGEGSDGAETGEAGEGSGSGEAGESSSDDWEKVNDAINKANEALDQREDGNDDAKSALGKKIDDNAQAQSKDKRGSAQATAPIEFKETDTAINWRRLLKRLIPKGRGEVEDTYSKMSRSSTSSMVTAMQTGMGRISPGEIVKESEKRGIVFVIDTSGSVVDKINTFNQEILKLLKQNSAALDNMFIVRFSTAYEVYKVDAKKMTARRVNNPDDVGSKKAKLEFEGPDIKLLVLFSKAMGQSTLYSDGLRDFIEMQHGQGMNVILFTDADFVGEPRFKKFFVMAKSRKNSTAIFITDADSLKKMERVYGSWPWMVELK